MAGEACEAMGTPPGGSARATLVDHVVRLVRLRSRFSKFVAVGCINAVVSYTVFSLALFATHASNLAVVITWGVGIIFNFFSTGRLVFGNRDTRLLIRFVMSYAVSMVVNLACINLLLQLGLGALTAQVLCLPVVVVVSYLINARFVFRSSRAG